MNASGEAMPGTTCWLSSFLHSITRGGASVAGTYTVLEFNIFTYVYGFVTSSVSILHVFYHVFVTSSLRLLLFLYVIVSKSFLLKH